MPAGTMTRDEAIVEITRRILAECEPVRIYLFGSFGSMARGDAGPDSDLDFPVVLRDDAPRDLVQGNRLDRALWGVPWAADVVPWRVSDFEGRAANVVASLEVNLQHGCVWQVCWSIVIFVSGGKKSARNTNCLDRLLANADQCLGADIKLDRCHCHGVPGGPDLYDKRTGPRLGNCCGR